MAVDYDLVILGGTMVAREAAIAARSLQARVALIEPSPKPVFPELSHRALVQASQMVRQARRAHQQALVEFTGAASWEGSWRWATATADALAELRSPAVLASLGIDVITGAAEFVRRPKMAVAVGERLLRSRAYLVATELQSVIPPLEGLAAVQPWTLENLWQQTAPERPASLIVLGNTPTAVELAQTFCRLGSRVTLLVGGETSNPPRMLPQVDLDAVRLIQAQLEAEGVTVLSHTTASQIRRIDGKVWVQANRQAIEADRILVADATQPQVASLNLEGVGVQQPLMGSSLNARLQTTHPQIYAFGQLTNDPAASNAIRTILRNALFFPIAKLNEQTLPSIIFTDPAIASVGLTEAQASQLYGKDVVVVRELFKQVDKAQMQGTTSGFCKLVMQHNGRILGVHLMGSAAEETIQIAALALQTRPSVESLAALPGLTPSFAAVLRQAAIAQTQQRYQQPGFWQDRLEDWMEFWRDRTR